MIILLCTIVVLAVVALLLRSGTTSTHSPAYTSYLQSVRWRVRARMTLAITKGRCCIFPWLRASEAHHLHYGHFMHEWPVRDTVPLSSVGHTLVHVWLLWRGPLRGPATLALRLMTVVTAIVVRPILSLVLIGLVWYGYQSARVHAAFAVAAQPPARCVSAGSE